METLAERIAREGPVNELDAVGWIVRLAKKLESMHARGIAHGCVSPDAMKTASASRLSLGMLIPSGGVRSRLEFRSPERIDANTATPADDAWSTAATLYALITGISPFAATDDDATRKKIRAGTFAPLSTFDVGDDDLQHIIEAALNPVMAKRMSSLTAFREALEGWHPDSKVRELPPMVDDQPEDDDEDARTVMRPVSAADAVRALIAQREQAAAASRASEPPPQAAKEIPSKTKEIATKATPAPLAPPVATPNHGLLEDDDENAKTSMIAVSSPLAYLTKQGPATVPAPPPTDMKSTPPGPPNTGFGMMRGAAAAKAPGGQAPRGNLAKSTVVGGFTAKQLIDQQQQQARAAAVPPPVPGISREAVIDDVDGEATVMREAPIDVMRKATSSIAPPADRKTPVDPTSAAVAAKTASADAEAGRIGGTNPAPETSMSFGSISLIEDVSEGGGAVEPRETPVSPSRGLNVKAILAGAVPPAAKAAETPFSPPVAAPSTGLATSALTAPSTSGMMAPPVPALSPSSTPAMAAPRPAAPVAAAPLAPAASAAPPVIAEPPEQPSALRGLFIGIGLALLIIAIAGGVYFFVIKH